MVVVSVNFVKNNKIQFNPCELFIKRQNVKFQLKLA